LFSIYHKEDTNLNQNLNGTESAQVTEPFPYGFNPLKVRYKHGLPTTTKESPDLFQSLKGKIQTERAKEALKILLEVSIP